MILQSGATAENVELKTDSIEMSPEQIEGKLI
jgi:hypothetical protein